MKPFPAETVSGLSEKNLNDRSVNANSCTEISAKRAGFKNSRAFSID
jgi:hypothetical protein